MASEVKLPRLGQGMEAGTIVKWLKAEGDRVEKGEPLYELDTDKVTQEVEAEASGVLLRIAVAEGEVPVGRTIAVIGEQGEDLPALDDGAPQSAEKPARAPKREADREEGRAAAAESAHAEPVEPEAGAAEPAEPGERVKASPLARRIAREKGIELARVRGTGPDGRIVAEDVERAQAQGPAAPARVGPGEVVRVPLTSIRRTIARRLTEAWQVPVFQLTVSVDMTRAAELVARARERAEDGGVRVTVTDVLAKVCAQALRRHPDVNVQLADDALLRFPFANIGIAVAAPQGLVVPVIRNAGALTLEGLAEARGAAVERARENRLTRDDLEGGTFTISNLGMYGVEQFVAVLNPPQAAILAVGATEERAVVRDGAVTVRPMLTVTLTVDHRAVDGGPAAEFLQTVKAYVEEPGLAL